MGTSRCPGPSMRRRRSPRLADVEIRVENLAALRRSLTQLQQIEARNELRLGLKRAADIVAQEARSRVPSRTGRARSSIRATAGGSRAFVRGGKKTVPYYGWLDFGSRTPRTGNPRSVGPWKGTGAGPRDGRFIYPAADAKKRQVEQAVADAIEEAVRNAKF